VRVERGMQSGQSRAILFLLGRIHWKSGCCMPSTATLYVFLLCLVLLLFSFHLAVQEEPKTQPCQPSPCGPYSQCREINGHAVCSCQANYIGSPPMCKPECMISADCALDKACINTKCQDPCPGTCGLNARCQVVNHNPICSCPAGFTGDPFVRCLQERRKTFCSISTFL
jgi:hypothetical protein